ncbi:Hypothetical predicted protein [Olea europaea subsp. europaea]|uniref:Uncharacterized protein n=1 Tax=Olea europaea subsp. europaea TaxID=158383 RepID=A0A8S0UXB0_OLEEU|nr:Hypothetical predicted protein [Olea europaea subsp. europaea]
MSLCDDAATAAELCILCLCSYLELLLQVCCELAIALPCSAPTVVAKKLGEGFWGFSTADSREQLGRDLGFFGVILITATLLDVLEKSSRGFGVSGGVGGWVGLGWVDGVVGAVVVLQLLW